MMRTPRDGLHGGSVIAVAQHRVDAVRRPHVQLVIVTPAGEFPIVVAPLEPANFRFVPHEFAGVVLRRAHVPLQNVSIPRSAAERGAAPRQRPHPRSVSPHAANLLALVRVPDLHLPLIGPHREVRPALRPPHRAHRIARTEVAQFRHPRRARGPEVDARAEPDGEHVMRRPIHQVEIEIILKRGGVQHLKRRPRDLTRRSARGGDVRAQRAVAADGREREGRVGESGGALRLEPKEVTARRAMRVSTRVGGVGGESRGGLHGGKTRGGGGGVAEKFRAEERRVRGGGILRKLRRPRGVGELSGVGRSGRSDVGRAAAKTRKASSE